MATGITGNKERGIPEIREWKPDLSRAEPHLGHGGMHFETPAKRDAQALMHEARGNTGDPRISLRSSYSPKTFVFVFHKRAATERPLQSRLGFYSVFPALLLCSFCLSASNNRLVRGPWARNESEVRNRTSTSAYSAAVGEDLLLLTSYLVLSKILAL